MNIASALDVRFRKKAQAERETGQGGYLHRDAVHGEDHVYDAQRHDHEK